MKVSSDISTTASRSRFNHLREMRWTKGITAEQCASALGIELFEFMGLERGRDSFTSHRRATLAEILDISLTDLVEIIGMLPSQSPMSFSRQL